jgi:hypothetical protein
VGFLDGVQRRSRHALCSIELLLQGGKAALGLRELRGRALETRSQASNFRILAPDRGPEEFEPLPVQLALDGRTLVGIVDIQDRRRHGGKAVVQQVDPGLGQRQPSGKEYRGENDGDGERYDATRRGRRRGVGVEGEAVGQDAQDGAYADEGGHSRPSAARRALSMGF